MSDITTLYCPPAYVKSLQLLPNCSLPHNKFYNSYNNPYEHPDPLILDHHLTHYALENSVVCLSAYGYLVLYWQPQKDFFNQMQYSQQQTPNPALPNPLFQFYTFAFVYFFSNLSQTVLKSFVFPSLACLNPSITLCLTSICCCSKISA